MSVTWQALAPPKPFTHCHGGACAGTVNDTQDNSDRRRILFKMTGIADEYDR
jgi:hypothetical protein